MNRRLNTGSRPEKKKKTHFRKTINAKLLPNDDLKVPNTKESLRTVFSNR